MQDKATIVAPATATGRAGVAVIRVSGPLVLTIVKKLIQKDLTPRLATCVNIKAQDGSNIDNALVILFLGPNSYTGEDVIEIHCHGSPVIVDMIINEIILHGASFAGPGEFTQRAFLNGKLDLYQAESVAALIEANSSQAVKSATRSLSGHFSKKISKFQAEMTSLRVYIEACLDFTDEDIDFISKPEVGRRLEGLLESMQSLSKSMQVGKLITEGAKVVLAGPTNAGKSSLFNQLSGADDAIVTPESGTTRDSLKQQIKIGQIGMSIDLIDTAGIRETTGIVEKEGIERSRQHVASCDIIILLLSSDSYTDGDFTVFCKKELNFIGLDGKIVFALNKSDLHQDLISQEMHAAPNSCHVSAKTGQGITKLQEIICSMLLGDSGGGEPIYIARRRHLVALNATLEHLELAQAEFIHGCAFEIIAEQLRLAQQTLSEITGEITSDDLLGEIFGSFCIGK